MAKRKYEVHAFCDTAFQFLCAQINSDYNAILRRDILPQLNVDPLIKLREIRTLMILDYYTEPASSTAVSEYLRFDRGTVSRATKILKQLGYVTSFANPEDKRSPLLELTDEGRALAEKYRGLLGRHFARLSDDIGEDFTEEESEKALKMLFLLRNRARQFVEVRENA